MGKKVLVVDDSAATCKVIKHCLEIIDHSPEQFYQAANGVEGMALLEKYPVDILFLDLNMPRMDGFEFIRCIQQRPEWSGLEIIVVSSETSRTRIQELENQNIRFIHKPFTPEDMTAVLEKSWSPKPAWVVNKAEIQKVMRDVFSTMTFTTMEIPPEPEATPSEVWQSKLTFTGAAAGIMTLRISAGIVPELVRNMLGEEETYRVTAEEQKDSVGELLNVIGGNVLNAQAGIEKVFHLGIPTTRQENHGEANVAPKASDQCYRLWFSKGWAELILETIE